MGDTELSITYTICSVKCFCSLFYIKLSCLLSEQRQRLSTVALLESHR